MIALFTIFAGAFWGVLAAVVALTPGLLRNPAGTIFLSFIFGGFVGFLCALPAYLFLRRKEPRQAVCFLLAVVTPSVCFFSMISYMLTMLMVFSGAAFMCAVLLGWHFLPIVHRGEGVCRGCGYDLRGSQDAGRCPECGRIFNPAIHPVSESAPAGHSTLGTWTRVSLIASFVFASGMIVYEKRLETAVSFDSAVWSTLPIGPERVAMARDLLKQRKLDGLAESDVINLLGKPDARYDHQIIKVGSSSLSISFDKNDRVESVWASALPKELKPFDEKLWKEGSDLNRLEMAGNLCTYRGDLLKGKSREEVCRLLGSVGNTQVELYYRVGSSIFSPSPLPSTSPPRRRLLSSLPGVGDPETDVLVVIQSGRVSDARLYRGDD